MTLANAEADMLEEYPKEAILKDGTPVTLRPLEREDAERLVAFFQRVPEDDRWYLRHDVSDSATVRQWALGVDYRRVIPIVAVHAGRIIGDVTLHRRRYGSTSHVGKVRIVIDPDYRSKRLGTWMLLDIIQLATGLGLEKLVAEVASNETAALKAIRRLDFVREAVIPELHKDQAGNECDLVILVKNLAPRWTDF
ncbi:MAG TPA: GNAT family N-acetyltransferase [Candidatus Binatia bacterium]|jgi:RimJ/RimL family protein N-acetyltransferase|nr:GNAT family N-acetyltransferase [Candidatus Binatia bacterium]